MAYKVYFDNVDVLTSYGVFLIESKGLLDPLKHKRPYTHNWDDQHGLEVDDGALMANVRKIALTLGIKADTKAHFKDYLFSFYDDILGKSGLVQLRIDEHTKVNMVMVDGHSNFERLIQWNNTLNVGRVRINFMEPYPVNRQWLVSSGQSTVTVNMPSGYEDETFTVFWGDGTRSEVSESGGGVTSVYTTYPKRLVVAGRIELAISISATNATEQTW